MLMHLHPSHATAAEYFRLGVETGTFPLDVPRRWADQVIAASADAPGDLVEVAWCRTPERLTAALNEVGGDRNREVAARWLLRTLRNQLAESREPTYVIRAAAHAVEQGGLGESQRLCLGGIADALADARMGYCGTPAEATTELLIFLDAEAAPEIPEHLR